MNNQVYTDKKEAVAAYLQLMGLRPQSRGHMYLSFVLEQYLNMTPFQKTLWTVTALYYDTTKQRAMSCARDEIARAYEQNPLPFEEQGYVKKPHTTHPTIKQFVSMALDWFVDHIDEQVLRGDNVLHIERD